jgi:urocanate hydratase
MVIVADGTKDAEERLRRVLYNDPAMGVLRHTDAGYELAEKTGKQFGLDI